MSIRNQGRSTSVREVGEAVAANGLDQLDLICIQPISVVCINVLRMWEYVMCPLIIPTFLGYLRSGANRCVPLVVSTYAC